VAFPVVARAKEAALKTKSIQNMRQVQMAIEIYAQSNNGSPSGTLEAMGLPPWPSEEFLGKEVREMYPPLRPSPNWNHYMYFPIPAEDDRRDVNWSEYTDIAGPSAVVICDPFFNPPRTDDYEMYWQDPYVSKHVLGMTISGSLIKRTRAGTLNLSWWLD
jgi:hypothetical protein